LSIEQEQAAKLIIEYADRTSEKIDNLAEQVSALKEKINGAESKASTLSGISKSDTNLSGYGILGVSLSTFLFTCFLCYLSTKSGSGLGIPGSATDILTDIEPMSYLQRESMSDWSKTEFALNDTLKVKYYLEYLSKNLK